MKIAVLSGKGGTGKTLVSVNLAAVAGQAVYADCDVEEPNGELFFKSKKLKSEAVKIKIPQVDVNKCNGCRACVDFCKFNALAYIKNRVFVFEELCHSCGACMLLCTQQAITEKEKNVGQIESGESNDVAVCTGIMNVGEASGVPIIKQLLAEIDQYDNRDKFIDCPPGSACTAMESIKDVDYCVLVAESTIFGLHNLKMIYKLVSFFSKKFGVILNKYDKAIDNPSEKFCQQKDIKILGRIPYDEKIAQINTAGLILVRTATEYEIMFKQLLQTITKEIKNETAIDS